MKNHTVPLIRTALPPTLDSVDSPAIMSNIDSRVADILDRSHGNDSEDEDALIASLEEDSITDGFREQRLQQLHSEFNRAKQQKAIGFGDYTEIKEEKALMEITASAERAVVHFFKDDFAKCGVMDGELEVCCSVPPSFYRHVV